MRVLTLQYDLQKAIGHGISFPEFSRRVSRTDRWAACGQNHREIVFGQTLGILTSISILTLVHRNARQRDYIT